jgi:hypothetical protein
LSQVTSSVTTVSISVESFAVSKTTVTSESNVTLTTSAVSSVALTTSSSGTEVVIKGDFNNNGKLDTGDAVILQRKLVRSLEISDTDLNYELNDDKRLNIWDYVILLRRIRSI